MQRLQIEPHQWTELSRLLDQALDLPPEMREQWLDSLDAQYGHLKSNLRDLLSRAARVETQDFLDALPKFDDAEVDAGSEQAGACIGPYRLLRELGTGGMGSVWLAERTDGLLKRPIALKLPLIASRRVGLAERMAREREILASLTHSNIARLYDAGMATEGRPYLALEYVEGDPINVYCEARKLEMRARVRLFLQVANAVAYAHAKLIIHRDLKPANILVTNHGEVRLLDFGVAKLLDEGLAKPTQLTELSGRALTLDYASPEQIAGEPLTIATDIYSLGVVLHELLSGARPYQLKRESRGALEDAILHLEPVRISNVVSKSLVGIVRGDLETIVLKALKKRPDERYATVNAFAEDLERWLTDRPVLALPDSRLYRLRRFATRNKLWLSVGLVVSVAIVAAAIVAVWQAHIAVEERDRAEQVKNLIASVFQQADPYSSNGEDTSALSLLRNARARVQSMHDLPPLTRIELMTLVGDSLRGLEAYSEAREVLATAVTDAERSLGFDHPMTLHARLMLLEAQRFTGETAQMESALRDLAPQIEASRQMSTRDVFRLRIIQTHLAIDSGRYAEALQHAERAEQQASRHLNSEEDTLSAMMLKAVVLQYLNDAVRALSPASDARALAERLYEQSPKHPRLLDARAIHARALGNAGRLHEAIPLLRQVVDICKDGSTRTGNVIGYYAADLAKYQLEAADIQGALASSELSFSVIRTTAQPGSFTYAVALHRRGQALAAARRMEEALASFGESVPMLFGALGAEHPRVLAAKASLVAAQVAMEKSVDEADVGPLDLDALDHLQANTYGEVAIASAAIQRVRGNYDAAFAIYRAALSALASSQSAWRIEAELHYGVGLTHLRLGNTEASQLALETSRGILADHDAPMHPLYSDVLVALGRAYLLRGEALQAVSVLRESDLFWSTFDPSNRWAGESALWLGRAYSALGRMDEAGRTLARAEKILSRSLIPSDTELVKLAHRGV